MGAPGITFLRKTAPGKYALRESFPGARPEPKTPYSLWGATLFVNANPVFGSRSAKRTCPPWRTELWSNVTFDVPFSTSARAPQPPHVVVRSYRRLFAIATWSVCRLG